MGAVRLGLNRERENKERGGADAIDDATGSGIRAVKHELDKTGDTASIGQRFVQQRDLLLLVNIVRAAPRLTRQSE